MLAVLMLLLTADAVSAARVHGKLSQKCVPGERHVLVADMRAVVYEGYLEIEGCTYGHRRSYALGSVPYGDATGGGGVFHETLIGTIVAYEFLEASGPDGPGPEGPGKNLVVVSDLQDGHVLHRVPTGVSTKPSLHTHVGIGRTTGIVVKSDGAVAWIVATGEELPNGEERGTFQVHAVDRSGNRVLAAGGNIDPSSLALAGSRLYWTQGGVPASAVLN